VTPSEQERILYVVSGNTACAVVLRRSLQINSVLLRISA